MNSKNVENKQMYDVLDDSMADYSAYVLLHRAIPDIRDGLKPSYRRILWAMKQIGATKLTKSANIIGEVMKFHPHGDSYPTVVGMAQKDGQQNPLIVGKGNFGMYSSDLAYASSRYTDAKLSELSMEMMKDVNKNGVKIIDNYDGTKKIPEVLPVKFPFVLTHAQSGMGVGFSSSIPSFNISEVSESIIKYLSSGEKDILIPDFGTKGRIVYDEEALKSINNTGRGSVKIRAKAEIDKDEIEITEIPYSTTREKIIEKIARMTKEGRLPEVKSIEDLSGLNGTSVIITAKKGTDMNVFLEKLYRTTPMESSYPSNMMVIGLNGLPKLMGTWGIIDEWISWRNEVIIKMLQNDTAVKNHQLVFLEALDSIKDEIDKVVEIIRNSTDDTIIENLMKEFKLDKEQAERISELKLRNLTTTYIKKQIDEMGKLKKDILLNEKATKSEKIRGKMIIRDLNDTISKFGRERLTEIIQPEVFKDIKVDEIVNDIPDYNVKVFVTKDNYIKKVPLTSLRGDFNIQVKSGDEIISETETTNNEEVLVFTNMNNVYKKRLNEIEDSKPSELGVFAPNEISLEKNETIQSILILSKMARYVLFGFEDGKVAKVDVEAYRTKQNRSVLRNSHADKMVILSRVLTEDIDLMAISEDKKTVLMNTEVINSKSSKNTQGATFIKLRADSKVSEYKVDFDDISDLEYYRIKSAGVGKLYK